MFIGQKPKQQILEDYSRYVNPGRVSVFKQMGLDFVPGRREGVWLWDIDGRRKLLNCRCSGGVFNLGHRPPLVVKALKTAKVPFGDAEALAAAVNKEAAAVIVETIPATSGMLFPPDDYYPRVRQICDAWHTQFIVDEVQSGLGRTGRMWAIEEWDVVPDILVSGKGLSGALYPMSATCHRPHLDAFFQANPFIHLSSFGGAALGCVTALAMLDQITEPGFMEHVQAMGNRFEDGFAELRSRYEIVAGWRQRGLMIGFELVDARMGPAMSIALAQNGVLAVFANHRPSTIQIMPPLIIQPGEVDFVLEALDRSLDFLTAHPGMLELIPDVGVV